MFFVAFIDMGKAYDRVDRKKMFEQENGRCDRADTTGVR